MAFEYIKNLRWFPVVGAFADLAAFIVALKLLLVAIGGRSNMEDAAIITYNTSFIGQNLSHYPADLAANISALIPASVTTPVSITQYLGIADWYSIHYLATCQGYFTVDPTTDLLTSTKNNITCVVQDFGYTFSLLDTVSAELKPSVKGVISDIPSNFAKEETKLGAVFLTLGIILAGIEFVVLALTIRGVLHINIHSFIIAVLAMLAFIVSSGVGTDSGRSLAGEGMGWSGIQFLAMTWAAVGLEALILILVRIEWRLEFFTPRNQRITGYWKPPEVSSWLSMKKNEGVPRSDAHHGEELEMEPRGVDSVA